MLNRYRRWYNAICARGQLRVLELGYERHHIIPRALGGSDDESNITHLTYREHFLAHWLLTRLTDGDERNKMLYALHMMTVVGHGYRIVAGWQYAIAKKASAEAATVRMRTANARDRMSKVHKGKKIAAEHRAALSKAFKGRKKSEQHRAKIGAAHKGKPKSAEHRAKIAASATGMVPSEAARANMAAAQTGRKHTPETLAKISAGNSGKIITPETRAKISATKTGRKFGPRSAEWRANISAGLRARALALT
jgi:hypothetical protein